MSEWNTATICADCSQANAIELAECGGCYAWQCVHFLTYDGRQWLCADCDEESK